MNIRVTRLFDNSLFEYSNSDFVGSLNETTKTMTEKLILWRRILKIENQKIGTAATCKLLNACSIADGTLILLLSPYSMRNGGWMFKIWTNIFAHNHTENFIYSTKFVPIYLISLAYWTFLCFMKTELMTVAYSGKIWAAVVVIVSLKRSNKVAVIVFNEFVSI